MSSKKLPIILIVALAGILIFQVITNDSGGKMVDPQTCEIYIRDSQIGGRQYQGEYDPKCLDFKDISP